MLKILTVAGTRPNFVKIAPLLAEMRRRQGVRAVLVHTGQHFDREMSDCFLDDLGVPRPDFTLTPRPSASPAEMRPALREVIGSERPDVVVVVGDVNSTLAGAQAAAELGVPVAHVEAGLRSFDLSMPEERNRIATDALSSLFFSSEPSGLANLLAEGRPRNRIFLAGNVMIDTLTRFLGAARRSTVLARLGLDDGRRTRRYALATLHRPAAVDDPAVLRRLWSALEQIAAELPVIFPAHPRTGSRLRECGLAGAGGLDKRVRITGPLSYLDFIRLESSAALVLTDSGGVQEETTAMGVPCLTLRNNTERPITVLEGTNQIVGLEPDRIVAAARRILAGRVKTARIPRLWDGRSSQRIVSALCRHYGSSREPATIPARFPSPAVPAIAAC